MSLCTRLRHPFGLVVATSVALCVLAPAARAADKPSQPDKSKHGWYVAGRGGPSFAMLSGVSAQHNGSQPTEDAANNGIGAFGMAGGYEWMYRYHIPLRTELEFMNRTEITYDASPELKHGTTALASTVQNVTTMAKGYWHFPVGSDKWWPFVSGGLGWSHNTAKSELTRAGQAAEKNTHATDTLAWSVGAGATFKLGPQVMNDIELRYVDLGKVDWGMPAADDLRSPSLGGFSAAELVFDLRYMF